MAISTNIIPNKLTMYQRVEGGVWHYRIKLKTGRDIHKLALQMGTSVAMLEKFYSKVSPRMNAAEHAGVEKRD